MLPGGLLKEYSRGLSLLVRILDIVAVFASGLFAFATWFRTMAVSDHYVIAFLVGAMLTVTVFSWFRVYESSRGAHFWYAMGRLVQAIAVVYVLLAGLAFLTKTGESFSRAWFLCWFLYALMTLFVLRGSLVLALRFMRSRGMNERKVIIIGAGKLSGRLTDAMHQALWTGFRIEKIVDESGSIPNKTIAGIPVEIMPYDLGAYIASRNFDEVWLAFSHGDEDRINEILFQLRHETITIRYILDLPGFDLHAQSFTDLAGFPAVNLNTSPMMGVNRIIKALEDKIIASVILLLISPLVVLIAMAIKCTSKGPVFFKQRRHGWDGRVINVYKFRTMVVHQEHDGLITQASVNDARITPLGRFLRKTSLDELPQFYNVLQGKMSIVGPRPHAVEHNEFYKDSIKAYMQRHRVKPGITGLAQVKGWRGQTDELHKMEKRVEYDLYYIENWSLFLDIKIIFLTMFCGFLNKNAY